MKKFALGMLAIIGLFVQSPPVNASSLDSFSFSDYDIRYDLSRDSDGRSQLRTIETITAIFPNYNQNHGIERAIPNVYDGHPTSVNIQSVEMVDGTPWNYTTYESNDNLVLRIGDASKYVQGLQTYVITYTQQDVTRFFSNTNSEEFYWDTNGTEWRVPIEKLTVSLAVDENIASNLNGKSACYVGVQGQGTSCTLDKAANIFTAQASSLSPGENVTVAVGFKSGTFTEYQPSLMERLFSIWVIVTAVIGLIAVGIMIWLFVRWAAWSGRKKDVGTIVPEYLPPKGVSLSTVASLIQPRGSVFTAQLIDFAVRHYIKIYEINKKSLFSSVDYTIEIAKDAKDLMPDELEVLTDIYRGWPTVGSRLSLSELKTTGTYTSLQDNTSKLTGLVRGTYALREKNLEQTAWFKKIGWILLFVAIFSLNPVMLIASLSAFVCSYTLWPLTDKGVDLYRYAEGMKLYIHVAEQERLKLLQSPDGVAKVGSVDINNSEQLLKLYERMLPFAILFGEEKEWSKRIGDLYQTSQTSPDWYSSNAAFNAAAFSAVMSTFNSSVAYSVPQSSSSGGSSGGGSSGGGGGGGGGGGW